MNKYHEALIKMERNTDEGIDELTGEGIGSYIQSEIDLLKELANKETPLKPKRVEYMFGEYNICRKCESYLMEDDNLNLPNYCYNCAQKIDWSDEE